jgi:HSP20 family molecular chaperone IbpA
MWKDNQGNARGSMRLLGCREMAKRIYVMLKEKDPEAIMVQHNSGGVVMPVNAFSEMTVTGEEFTQDVFRDGNYYRIYPLDIFRMECIPQPWGMVTCVMPEFVRAVEIWDPAREKGWVKQPENLKALWHLMGLAIIHDSALQGDNRIVQVMDIVTLVKKRLGWSDETEFYPYWNPEKSIFVKQTPADENTIVSGYLAEKGILLVPMNNTDQDTEMTIQIKPNRYGRDFVFTDERTKETFKTENGLLKLNVPARQPRLLVWEKKQ